MAEPLRVLFATYPMAFHTPGGGEMQLLAYRRHLGQFGIKVDLLDPWNPRFESFDLVHFFSCVGGSWHLCNFVKSLGLPLLVSSSLWITPDTRDLYPCGEIRAQLALADRIVTNADIESDMLASVLDLPRERFDAIPNAVERIFLEAGDPALFRETTGIREPFALTVGNIEPRKNQLRLAEAMAALPDHRLVLVGHCRDGAYRDAVLAAGRNRITLIGPIEHGSPLQRSAYAAADLFALPSTLETPGLAALEAAAQGRPVVLTAQGSTRSYFGDLVDYADPASVPSIRDAIGKALRRGPADRDALMRLVADRYLWPQVVEQLAALYRDVAAKRDRTS